MRAPTSTMEELRKRLEELISEPLTSPRGEVQAVLESVANDPTAAERLIRQALRQTENDEIWLDEVPRIGPDHVPDFTRRAPDLAAEAALVMLGHMTSDTWGTVTSTTSMRPCGGRTEVLRVLTEEGHLGHAEDVATQSFEREKARDRWRVAISVCGGDSGGPIYESSYSDGVYTYRAISIIARGATSATGPRFNSVVRNQFSAYKRYRDGENVPYCCF